ncbi:cytochrome P450 [Melanogaster broomeanus]|nr:cytochrome P450 [Melanogaster broomeanus]
MIIINSEKIAKILLDRRSNIYSDRPRLVTTAPFSAAIIMCLLYDYEISPGRDHFVDSLSVERNCLRGSVARKRFDYCHLPFRRRAALSKKCAEEMLSAPFEYVRKREADGAPSSAMVSSFLRSEKHTDDPSAIELIKEVAAAGFIGGSETSASSMHTFFFALVQNPDVQKRAQAEIDDVVGTDRLPNFDDRPSLPICRGGFKRDDEDVSHRTPRFDFSRWLSGCTRNGERRHFRGLFHSERIYGRAQRLVCSIQVVSRITTQAFMFAVTRAMLRDPETYPEPNSFKPERFFKDGKLDDEPSTSNVGYGFGRRICPGRYTADASIWAGLVTFLSTMTISKALDAQGREIDVDPKFTCGVTSCPAPLSLCNRSAACGLGRGDVL